MPVSKKKPRKRRKKFGHSNSIPKEDSKKNQYEDFFGELSKHFQKPTKPRNKYTINSTDKGGVKRIYSPFNKFANITSRIADSGLINKMPWQSTSRPTGLSRQEKSYVICSCQSRSSRYTKLKALAAEAMAKNKIFSVYGSCGAVRKALLERGWVEKIPPNRMNLTKIRNGTFANKTEIHGELERLLLSNLVEKCIPNFVWRTTEEYRDRTATIDMTKEYQTISNKLKIDAMWTSKQGLCSSMKRNYWFHIEDLAEVNGPRTYNSYDVGEIESFVKDYKITACTSLLKWVLSMVANERPVFNETGKASMNVIVFALNRCKDYLFHKQHKDIDGVITTVSSGQWNVFLKKYYRIIAKEEVFQSDRHNKLPLYLGYAKFLLKEIHRYRPQLSCEGCHNIWIIKPAHCSRGRGIRMASKLGVITNLLNKTNAKYVVQKYIEEPLLIHETKFDIRQYYLVTSTYPLVIWMYKDCYLKFSSQKYNLRDYHESIHLTNNAVQRKYANCKGRHKELPQNNMWDSDKYKDYLNRIGKNKVWDNVIYPGMKKSIIGIMLSCQDSLSVSKNRFELYGCDFILDKEYKPWLIEINSCPDLNHTTQVTAKICPAVITDIVKVVIDYANDPSSPTGKFECIYRQPMTIPRFGSAADLYVRGYRLPLEYFYKGNIKIKESYDHANIDKQHDIKYILNKLKQLHNCDIMVEPEDDCDSTKEKEQETFTHVTASEYDLSVAATIITEQLDEILERIISDPSLSSKSEKRKESFLSFSLPKSPTSMKTVQSVTDINFLVPKTSNRYASAECLANNFTLTECISAKHPFSFSKLEDSPVGRPLDVTNIKKVFNELSSLISSEDRPINNSFKDLRNNVTIQKGNQQNNIFDETVKMISFINKKEKEYSNYLSRKSL